MPVKGGLTLKEGKLHGKALFVLDAMVADLLLLAVGRYLVLVPANEAGVTRTCFNNIDRTRGLRRAGCSMAPPLFRSAASAVPPRRSARRSTPAAGLWRPINPVAAQRMIESDAWSIRSNASSSTGRPARSRATGTYVSRDGAALSLRTSRSLVWYAAHCQSASDSQRAS